MGCPLGYTEDGFELQFGTNHIGHFELFRGLVPALKEAAKKTGKNSRLVVVSSAAHALTPVDFNDPNFKSRPYNKVLAYGQVAFFRFKKKGKLILKKINKSII